MKDEDILLIEQYFKDEKFRDVIKIANDLIHSETTLNFEEMEKLIKQLAGYGIYIGAVAGLYLGERSRVQYSAMVTTKGTGKDKEAAGKSASASLRTHHESLCRVYGAVMNASERLDTIYRERKKDYRQQRGFGDGAQ